MRDPIKLTFNGETKTLWGWQKATGLNRTTIKNRIQYGWTPERILTTPVMDPQVCGRLGKAGYNKRWWSEARAKS